MDHNGAVRHEPRDSQWRWPAPPSGWKVEKQTIHENVSSHVIISAIFSHSNPFNPLIVMFVYVGGWLS